MKKQLIGAFVFAMALMVNICMAAHPSAKLVSASEGWDDLPAVKPADTDWPWWCGPNFHHIAKVGKNPPLEWSEDKNVVWKTAIPGKGYATPCIVAGKMYVPTGDKKTKTIKMLCLDCQTGKKLWETEMYKGKLPKMHAHNSYATTTPACDGERVFFSFQTSDAIRLIALDLKGKILWDKAVAPFKSVQGYGASPVIYKSAVIVAADGSPPGHIAAFHRKTGKVIWRVKRPKNNENYSSPIIATIGGRDEMIIIGMGSALGKGKTMSYDPNTGKELWKCDGPASYAASTATVSGNIVYVSGGYPQKSLVAIQVRAGKATVKWRHKDTKVAYVPTPLVSDGLLYSIYDKTGLMRCYDSKTGAVIWNSGSKMRGQYYSSPVLAGDRIYIFDRKGAGYVLQAGRKFKLLKKNKLSEGMFATPVFIGDLMYLRTMKSVYCIGIAK